MRKKMPITRSLRGTYDPSIECKMYDETFYEDNKKYYEKGVENYVAFLNSNFEFSSIVDIGCGTGAFISPLQSTKEVLGIDFSDGSKCFKYLKKENFLSADITKPLPINKHFDIVMSLEVYEHIPKEFELQYLQNIVSLTPEVIVISCAAPGQIGRRHYNCCTQEHVIEMFSKLGYSIDEDKTADFKKIKKLATFYRKNALILVKS